MADLEDLVYLTINAADGPLTSREIAKKSHLALQQVRGAVARMTRKGLIEPIYEYPKTGLKFRRGIDLPQKWRIKINDPDD